MSKVKCPCCGKEVSLTKAGNLYMHKPEFSLGWEWCEGSKQNYEMLMGEMLAEEIQEETQTEEEKKEEIKKVFTQLSKLQFEDQENVSNEKYISLDSEENQLNELAIQYFNSGSLTFLNHMHEILEKASQKVQGVLDEVQTEESLSVNKRHTEIKEMKKLDRAMKIRGFQKGLLQDKFYTSPNRARFRKGKTQVFVDANKNEKGEISIIWPNGLKICKLCSFEDAYLEFIDEQMPLKYYR